MSNDLEVTNILFNSNYYTQNYTITDASNNDDVSLIDFYNFYNDLIAEIQKIESITNQSLTITADKVRECAEKLIAQQTDSTIKQLPINIEIESGNTIISNTYINLIKNLTTGFIVQGLRNPIFNRTFIISGSIYHEQDNNPEQLLNIQEPLRQPTNKLNTNRLTSQSFINFLKNLSSSQEGVDVLINYLQQNKDDEKVMQRLQEEYMYFSRM